MISAASIKFVLVSWQRNLNVTAIHNCLSLQYTEVVIVHIDTYKRSTLYPENACLKNKTINVILLEYSCLKSNYLSLCLLREPYVFDYNKSNRNKTCLMTV